MKIFKILFLLLVVVTSSCELSKEIDYDTYYEGDRLMVHGFITPQNGVQVLIKKSVSPNQVLSDDKVQNAIVTLYEDNLAIQKLQRINDYNFSSDVAFIPKASSFYSIKIEAEGLNEALSNRQSLIMPVEIDSLKVIIEENTFYENLVVWFTNGEQFKCGYYLKTYCYINGVIDSSLMGDEIFNPFGLLNNIVVGTNSVEYQLYDDYDSLRVVLYTLSQDLTTFLGSFQNYESSKEDPFFEQTYPVYSNIENGYGIFASYSYCSKTIKRQ
ncbi:MAG: DUF4249 family protein [Bacteroidota bacterium]|nr:DUF4249 family protein [Bacteroidota bacterium]